tara:strand:- start:220 stop:1797 length:1578 start_codon:yes stop_codon:yes gene_type:complete
VLTALLALNISKEVLEAFQTMDNSIGFSYSEKVDFNKKEYDSFRLKALNNPEKLSFWNDVALDVKKQSANLVAVIDSIRFKIQDLAELNPETKELIALDNKEITIKILTKSIEDGGYGYGLLLKEARQVYKDFLLSLDTLDIYNGADSIYRNNINFIFSNPDYDADGEQGRAVPQSWEKRYYGHVPVAAMAFMNQMKLDVGNMEGAVLELLQKQTGQSSITVNQQLGVVKSPKQSIMLGDSFKATIFVAGVDTNQLPKFNIYQYDSEGNRVDSTVIDTLDVDGSQGLFAIKPNRPGTYWVGGDILVQSEEGEKTYEFKQQYRVDEAMSVISPDKMNVLYTEVLNPVSISVPGYSSDELSLHSNFSQCNIRRVKNGTYEIKIPEQRGKNRKKELTLTVKANNKTVGKPLVFRVKNVPDPVPMVGGVAGYGEMTSADLASAWGVVAKMKDFDFEMRYKVLSYTMSYQGSGGQQDMDSKSGEWPAAIKRQFGSIKRGQSVIFRDIKVQIAGTNSKPRTLPATVTIKIK